MPGLHRIKIMDTCQVREYPDSTTDRIKMADDHDINRKLLEKQRVWNCLASYEVHIGHFFYNVNAIVSFGSHLTLYSAPEQQSQLSHFLDLLL